MAMPSSSSLRPSRPCLAALLWLAVAVVVDAIPYAGTVCSGAVNFELQADTNFAQLDAAVLDSLADTYPRWIESGCFHDLQKHECMAKYLPKALTGSPGYCFDECMEALDACRATINLLKKGDDAVDFAAVLTLRCQLLLGSPCENGGTLTEDAALEPVCPKPLLVPDNKHHEGKLIDIAGTECVAPCPTIIYTDQEWHLLESIVFYCSLASCIGTLIIGITHTGNKYTMLRYVSFGYCLPMALVSLWIPINRGESQVCDGPAHYVIRGEWCLAQGTMAIWSFKWAEAWVLCLGIHLWFSVVRRTSAAVLAGYRKYYTAFSVIYPTAITAAFFGLRNIGFDWFGRSGPVCLFLVSQNDIYYWTMHFATANAASAICFVTCMHCIWYMNRTILATRKTNVSIKDNFSSLMKQLLKYNHRILLFVFFYCVIQFVVSGIILKEEFSDGGYESSAEDLVGCLLENSDDTDPSYAQTICGDRPKTRPAMYIALITSLQGSSNGLFLFLVYGTDGRFTKFVHNIMNTSKQSSEDDSSTRRTSTFNKHQRNSTTTSSWGTLTSLFRIRSTGQPKGSKGSLGSLDLELTAMSDAQNKDTPRAAAASQHSEVVVIAEPAAVDIELAHAETQKAIEDHIEEIEELPVEPPPQPSQGEDADEERLFVPSFLGDDEETKAEDAEVSDPNLNDNGEQRETPHESMDMMDNEMHSGHRSTSSSTNVDPQRQKNLQVFFRKPSSEAISPRSNGRRKRPEGSMSSTSSLDAV